jgi:hypothetical protein
VVFEVKHLKYTLFDSILLPHREPRWQRDANLRYHMTSHSHLLISASPRIIVMYVVRIGREQFLPQQPVTSRSTSASIQRKLIKQRNT